MNFLCILTLIICILADIKSDASSTNQKLGAVGNVSSSIECGINAVGSSSHVSCSQTSTNLGQAPRALHGQSNSQPRSIHGSLNSIGSSLSVLNQGRPIVKVGMNQNLNTNAELSRTNINKTAITHNKQFLSGSGQGKHLI